MKNFDNGHEQRKAATVLLSIALTFFFAFIGFFAWHTARMRSCELDYVRTEGVITGVERHTGVGSHSTYYSFVISYTFDGKSYEFEDRYGYNYVSDIIGTTVEIYVNPKSPAQAEVVTSADFVSIICACFFAFFTVTYSVGMNVLLSTQRSTPKKRFLFVWGAEILLGIAVLLLFWLGLPNSGFGEVFVRIKGAIGVTVVSGLVLLVTLLDGIITYKLKSKR